MSHTNVREIPSADSEGVKSFVALERQWVGTNPQYVSEIDADVIKGLSGRSAHFSEMEHVCSLRRTKDVMWLGAWR